MDYRNLAEEELKLRIAEQFFPTYDCAHRIGKIDFAVTLRNPQPATRNPQPATRNPQPARDATMLQSLLWAEAKRGTVTDIYKPLVQLVLTIGKARTFDTYLPPPFLGVFDAEKIVFLPYKEIMPFFALNDFNWNVTPSDDSTREFGLLYEAIRVSLEGDLKDAPHNVRTQRDASGAKGARLVWATSGQGEDHTDAVPVVVGAQHATPNKTEIYLYRYDTHAEELRAFIQQHFSQGGGQIQVNKNNFVAVYQRWLTTVQPSIAVDWALLKKQGIIDGDFFLADLLSEHNQTLKEALYVLLQDNRYVLDRKVDARGLFQENHVFFKDKQRAHTQFWSLYQRPPREEYWAYIIDRRDLLVPQDVRERKGSFFTPRQWVELSQQYIADVLGENWQEEYYVWDCAAGTGNLLNGLTNKYHIWASTLDPQDVQVMKDRIANGANLLESHVFQFDFLNDEFSKLPAGLQEIIHDPEKRRKLVVYINPPYAEAGNARTRTGERNKSEVSRTTRICEQYHAQLGLGIRELFAQFLMRIVVELGDVRVGLFSKLKYLQGTAFRGFRKFFYAQFLAGFLVPADTFDNVRGAFPIAFALWDLSVKSPISRVRFDVYWAEYERASVWKEVDALDHRPRITDWVTLFPTVSFHVGYTGNYGPDLQHNRDLYLSNAFLINRNGTSSNATKYAICRENLLPLTVYFSVRLSITATWLNDRDQFLSPRDGWQTDAEFQNNCLAFTLFHPQNRITATEGINHWIPFTEAEVEAKDSFESHFMTQFIQGRLALDEKKGNEGSLFQSQSFVPSAPLVFSPEAVAVFDAGRELWRYYHAQPAANPNASYYDIRAHFQGRNDKGKMNAKSDDPEYMRLLGSLKEAMEGLRLRIVPKVYEYGFLIS